MEQERAMYFHNVLFFQVVLLACVSPKSTLNMSSSNNSFREIGKVDEEQFVSRDRLCCLPESFAKIMLKWKMSRQFLCLYVLCFHLVAFHNRIRLHCIWSAWPDWSTWFVMYILILSCFSYVFSLEKVVKPTLKSEREAMRSSSSFVAVEAGGAPEWWLKELCDRAACEREENRNGQIKNQKKIPLELMQFKLESTFDIVASAAMQKLHISQGGKTHID